MVSTIPAGILGLLFEEWFQSLFSSALIVGIALLLNGVVLGTVELLRRRTLDESAADDRAIARLSYGRAILIGFAQSLALIPGFSRTGLTMAASLALRLGHENSARYAFLLATPIIAAAALLKLPGLLVTPDQLSIALAGTLSAAFAAYVPVRFLLRFFQTRSLVPFAVYCVVAGAASVLLLR